MFTRALDLLIKERRHCWMTYVQLLIQSYFIHLIKWEAAGGRPTYTRNKTKTSTADTSLITYDGMSLIPARDKPRRMDGTYNTNVSDNTRKCVNMLAGNRKRKRSAGRPLLRWDIEMDHTEMGCQWRAGLNRIVTGTLVITVMNPGSIESGNSLISCATFLYLATWLVGLGSRCLAQSGLSSKRKPKRTDTRGRRGCNITHSLAKMCPQTLIVARIQSLI
jgi:hypothetical protein